MADNNHKVTIDAEWFAELYAKANANQVKELRFDNPPYSLWVKIDELKKERDELKRKLELECASCPAVKERDALKAKLSTAQNYEAVIAAKNREIEGVKQERNRLNAKVNELMKKLDAKYGVRCGGDVFLMNNEQAQNAIKNVSDELAAAERCIEDVFSAIENDCSDEVNEALYIISDYREKKEAK